MAEIQKTDYPRYAFLDDLAWIGIFYYRAYSLVERHCDEAKAEYERLKALPAHRQLITHEEEMQWRQAITEGTLTIEQVRKELYAQYGILACMYDRSYSAYHAVNCHQLTNEEAQAQEERVLLVDKHIDQILHARDYPGLVFAFDWGGLHLVARPTGVIEDLCYHFVSTRKGRHGKNWNERFDMTRRLAHAEAYLLGQDEVITHLHARNNGKETIVQEAVDVALGQRFFE